MVNLIGVTMAYRSTLGEPIKQPEIDALFGDLFSYTGGKLVTRLEAVIPERDHLDVCRRAVAERNRLVRTF